MKTYTKIEEVTFEKLINKDISILKNKIITKIEKENNKIYFYCDNIKYLMFHNQECCESVNIEDIAGDLNDLLNTPVLTAYEDTNHENDRKIDDNDDSFSWTFYVIRTIKGTVTISWYGTSNGYYSEEADFFEVTTKKELREITYSDDAFIGAVSSANNI